MSRNERRVFGEERRARARVKKGAPVRLNRQWFALTRILHASLRSKSDGINSLRVTTGSFCPLEFVGVQVREDAIAD
jgi:hypothetical protein